MEVIDLLLIAEYHKNKKYKHNNITCGQVSSVTETASMLRCFTGVRTKMFI